MYLVVLHQTDSAFHRYIWQARLAQHCRAHCTKVKILSMSGPAATRALQIGRTGYFSVYFFISHPEQPGRAGKKLDSTKVVLLLHIARVPALLRSVFFSDSRCSFSRRPAHIIRLLWQKHFSTRRRVLHLKRHPLFWSRCCSATSPCFCLLSIPYS